jgi:hypothetical protein
MTKKVIFKLLARSSILLSMITTLELMSRRGSLLTPSLFKRIKGVKYCEVSAKHGDSAAWEIPGFENGNGRVDKKRESAVIAISLRRRW